MLGSGDVALRTRLSKPTRDDCESRDDICTRAGHPHDETPQLLILERGQTERDDRVMRVPRRRREREQHGKRARAQHGGEQACDGHRARRAAAEHGPPEHERGYEEARVLQHVQRRVARGRAICANDMITPLEDAETAVREAFERHVLREDVVTAALEEAVHQLRPPAGGQASRRAELDRELAKVRTELGRLTEAIIAGGDLLSLTQAMKDRERRSAQLERELQGLDELAQVSQIDEADLAQELRGILLGWRELLAKHTSQARQILRELLDGRLAFTPR